MRDLTARRLDRLVNLMAAASDDHAPCRPGTLLEEVITHLPLDGREGDDTRPHLFEELVRATDSLADAGLMRKDDAGWSLTLEGLRTARSVRTVSTARGAGDSRNARSPWPMHVLAPRTEQRLGDDEGLPSRAFRSVGLAGDFQPITPSGFPQPAVQSWHTATRRAWAPDDPALHLRYDGGMDTWIATLGLAAGHYEFKVVVNDSWAENYGARGMPCGPNLSLDVPSARRATFAFDAQAKQLAVS